MIGSTLMRSFPEFVGTTRADTGNERVLPEVDISRVEDLNKALDWAAPDAVVNCAGIVKSECDKHDASYIYAVNSSAPHTLARMTEGRCRVVHISTDCVFDGAYGARTEEEAPDATDVYGRTKASGELVGYEHCVTLRTSFIGRDHVRRRGLLEWLLTQSDEAPGYSNMLWSGLSTYELARAIGLTLSRTDLRGLYHVAGPLISKAELLRVLVAAYGLRCRVREVSEPRLDRSLNGSKFKNATDYLAPNWVEMAKELAGP
jgi:dTDP-4-dehydrorhamnose reductase